MIHITWMPTRRRKHVTLTYTLTVFFWQGHKGDKRKGQYLIYHCMLALDAIAKIKTGPDIRFQNIIQ